MANVATQQEASRARQLRERRRIDKQQKAVGDHEDFKPYGEIDVQPGQDPLEAAVYDPNRQYDPAQRGLTLAEQAEAEEPQQQRAQFDTEAIEQEFARQLRPLRQRAVQKVKEKAVSYVNESDLEALREIADFEHKRASAKNLLSVRFAALNLAKRLRDTTERLGMGPGTFLFILIISIAFDLKDIPVEAVQELFGIGSTATFGATLVVSVGVWIIDTIGALIWVLCMYIFFHGRSHFITRKLWIRMALTLFIESIPVLAVFTGYSLATVWMKYDLDKQQKRLKQQSDAIEREAATMQISA